MVAFTLTPFAGAAFDQTYAAVDVNIEAPRPPFAVGTMGLGSDGTEWVFCIAGGTIVAKDVVLFVPATYTVNAITSTLGRAAVGNWVGVAGAAATVGQFIWVCRSGYLTGVNMATSAAAFTLAHDSATAGRITTTAGAGTTAAIVGIVAQATAAANVANVMINRPYVSALD